MQIQRVKDAHAASEIASALKMAIFFHCGGLDLCPAGAVLKP